MPENVASRRQAPWAATENRPPSNRQAAFIRKSTAIDATKKRDQRLAQDIIARHHDVTNQAEALIAHFAARLSLDEADRFALHRFGLDVVDKLRRIDQLATGRVLLLLPPTAGGQETSRETFIKSRLISRLS